MSHSVTNQRNDSTYQIDGDETILDAALREQRVYPYGCRNGVCGACKASLISGSVDYGNHEEFALSEDDKAAGKLLLCQARPLQDVVIDVNEISSGQSVQIKVLPCRVKSLTKLADDVMALHLTLPKSQTLNFLPGQYIDILLKDGQRRSFSIANRVEDSLENGLELHIRHVIDGHFTGRVFTSLKERDLLRFEGPFGTYIPQSEPDTTMVMVAGGTGFAPVKAIIEEALETNPEQRIDFYWGARDVADLYMNDWVEGMLKQYPNISYTPVLSEHQAGTWQGQTGFVHDAVLANHTDFSNVDVYASGPPIMVDSVRDGVLAKGLNVERFFFDSFDFTPSNS